MAKNAKNGIRSTKHFNTVKSQLNGCPDDDDGGGGGGAGQTDGRRDGLHVDSGSDPKPGHLAAFHGAGATRRPAPLQGSRIERNRPPIKKLKRGSLARFSLMCPCVGLGGLLRLPVGRSPPLTAQMRRQRQSGGGGKRRHQCERVTPSNPAKVNHCMHSAYYTSSTRTLQRKGEESLLERNITT